MKPAKASIRFFLAIFTPSRLTSAHFFGDCSEEGDYRRSLMENSMAEGGSRFWQDH